MKKLYLNNEGPIKKEGLYLFGGVNQKGKYLEGLWYLRPCVNDKLV
jgi:hypothetical protein